MFFPTRLEEAVFLKHRILHLEGGNNFTGRSKRIEVNSNSWLKSVLTGFPEQRNEI